MRLITFRFESITREITVQLPHSVLYAAFGAVAALGTTVLLPQRALPVAIAADTSPGDSATVTAAIAPGRTHGRSDRVTVQSGAVERVVPVSPDVTIRVQEHPGDGETVVMLPGAGMGAAALGEIPQRIASAGYRIIAMNPRGAAGSTGPVEGVTPHDLAADVAAVIEQLGGGPVHLLGHAGGNRIGRCVAADRPDLVTSVILLSAGGLVPPDAETARVMERVFAGEQVPEEEHDAILLAPSSDPSVLDSWVIWPDAQRAFQSAASSTPLDEWWHGGGAQMLVVQGLDDKVAPPGNGRALAGEPAGRVQVVELPDAGHALPVEQPVAVTDAILAWLSATERVS